MQALGLIETKGLLAAIESADAMLKAAEVSLLEKTIVGGGLVSVAVTGDVAAVQAAVDAGAAAVGKLNGALLISRHVIPRPHPELANVIVAAEPAEAVEAPDHEPEKIGSGQEAESGAISVKEAVPEAFAENDEEQAVYIGELSKEAIDRIAFEKGMEEAIALLSSVKVVKLRNLARGYKDFGITGRLISKADRQMIITEFRQYYERQN